MTEAWFAAFGLLTILSIANAIVLVAVMRQIGVLHERLAPTGYGQLEGPRPGTVLRAPECVPVDGGAARRHPTATIWILGYVTPGCGLCEALPRLLRTYSRSAPPDTDVFLVTDVSEEEARSFLRHADAAPFVRVPGFRDEYGIPGSPYVVAVRKTTEDAVTVLAAGVVNTLEQLEDLGDQARGTVDHFDSASSQSADRITSTREGWA